LSCSGTEPKAQTQSLLEKSLLETGRAVIETERDAVARLLSSLDENFAAGCRLILACKGRTVVTGMGKSGHIARKVAATMASTGTPAFFVHPGEAGHGDIGMVTDQDVAVIISHSGETEELVTLLPVLKRLGVPLVAITGNPSSLLATKADVSIHAGIEEEACPFGLAPTASTTAALVLGDALAIALVQARGFSMEDFARSHPRGALGRKLLLVSDIMHTGGEIPRVAPDTALPEALMEMTAKSLGVTAVADGDGRIAGIFTDGDLRRALDSKADIRELRIAQAMTRDCKTVPPNCMAVEALRIMETSRINALLVADRDRRLVGILNMHDLLRARVV